MAFMSFDTFPEDNGSTSRAVVLGGFTFSNGLFSINCSRNSQDQKERIVNRQQKWHRMKAKINGHSGDLASFPQNS